MIDPNTPNHRLFGKNADARLAQELYNTDKPEYYRRRAQVEKDGLVAPRPVWADPDYRKRFDPPQLSEETIRLRATVPLAEVQSYYCGTSAGATNNLSRLATEDPEKYRLIKSAAIAWEIIPAQPMPTAPEPRPVSQFVTVSDADCDAAGLPRNYQTTASGLETIHRVIKEVAEAKSTAEQVAATTAEKLARDAAVDESVAQFGRLLEINREIDANQRERESEVKAA
ncbi:MAG TPA: hypothetical protein VNU20_03535 [Candidatus Sulfotelmatobacter sp.]|jgi:hypothetical protein|nr:hypothetical protein [Candidatus Sulfotelmatobacter sp.]